jgi:hypothetical protein
MARCSAAWPEASGDRADAALERGDALFEHGIGRIGDARIDVAGALHVEQRGGLVGILEDEAGGQVDRRGAGAELFVGHLARMQARVSKL